MRGKPAAHWCGEWSGFDSRRCPPPGVQYPMEQLLYRLLQRTVKDGPVPECCPELGPCWMWMGSRSGNGYGQISITGRRTAFAHRAMYQCLVGPIEPGLEIDHLCRNRLCVNPLHLEPVTHSENIRRAHRSARVDRCKRGHPLDGTRTRPGGGRYCRICVRDSKRSQRARIREMHPTYRNHAPAARSG